MATPFTGSLDVVRAGRNGGVDATVKVVRVDELLPEDKGYKLHVQSAAVN